MCAASNTGLPLKVLVLRVTEMAPDAHRLLFSVTHTHKKKPSLLPFVIKGFKLNTPGEETKRKGNSTETEMSAPLGDLGS